MKATPWSALSPEQREQIERNRASANYETPFKGKNRTQRFRLNMAFHAMKTHRSSQVFSRY